MTQSTRLRLAAVVLAATAAVPLAATPAAAQPQCPVATTLDEYLVTGFSCRLRGIRFSNFSLTNTLVAVDGGVATGVDPASVLVLAFRPPILPLSGFGFLFDGFVNSASVASTTAPNVRAEATTVFSFDFASVRRELGDASFYGTLTVDRGSRPGQLDATSSIDALVSGPSGTCLDEFRDRVNTGQSTPSPKGDCLPNALSSGSASFTLFSQALRSGGRRDIDGSAQTTLDALQFHGPRIAAVPEPATIALVAGGLTLLAAASRRRRG